MIFVVIMIVIIVFFIFMMLSVISCLIKFQEDLLEICNIQDIEIEKMKKIIKDL